MKLISHFFAGSLLYFTSPLSWFRNRFSIVNSGLRSSTFWRVARFACQVHLTAATCKALSQRPTAVLCPKPASILARVGQELMIKSTRCGTSSRVRPCQKCGWAWEGSRFVSAENLCAVYTVIDGYRWSLQECQPQGPRREDVLVMSSTVLFEVLRFEMEKEVRIFAFFKNWIRSDRTFTAWR